jgi:phage portal protein BeeE
MMPFLKEEIDEQGTMPRKFDYVAASTMTVKYDLNDVTGYTQTAQGTTINYSPQEIVHIKFAEFNGEVNGLSGLKALAKEVAMMYMLKENIRSQLDNGGSPDSIIFLKNASNQSRKRFDRLKLALESFSHIKNSHGNLAIDGEVGVHQLGASLKDMEYRELAMFLISEFLLAIGLPTTRVPFLMTGSGGAANKGNLAGDSEQSYQKKVNSRRLQWEQALNEQVFSKLGFTIKFRRDNLQDEVRETQATQMRYASVKELVGVLQSQGKKLTDSALLDMLSGVKTRIFSKDIEEADMEMMMQMMGGNPNQPSVNGPKNNVQEANSRARIDNATNRGVSL